MRAYKARKLEEMARQAEKSAERRRRSEQKKREAFRADSKPLLHQQQRGQVQIRGAHQSWSCSHLTKTRIMNGHIQMMACPRDFAKKMLRPTPAYNAITAQMSKPILQPLTFLSSGDQSCTSLTISSGARTSAGHCRIHLRNCGIHMENLKLMVDEAQFHKYVRFKCGAVQRQQEKTPGHPCGTINRSS